MYFCELKQYFATTLGVHFLYISTPVTLFLVTIFIIYFELLGKRGRS